MKSVGVAKIKIRRARLDDASRLAELCTQLGYPSNRKDILQRMKQMRPPALHAILVAESNSRIIGWLHMSVTPLLEVPLRAEVNGLVVDEAARSLGTGAKLLAKAEHWAAAKGCKSVSVRSNVLRKRAHAFYLRQGYEHYKTQKAFRKPL